MTDKQFELAKSFANAVTVVEYQSDERGLPDCLVLQLLNSFFISSGLPSMVILIATLLLYFIRSH